MKPTLVVLGTNKAHAAAEAVRERDTVVVTEPWYAEDFRAHGAGTVVVVADIADTEATVVALQDTCSASSVRPEEDERIRILATSERTVRPAARLRARLGVEGTSPEIAVGFVDKGVMADRLLEAGVPMAATVTVSSAEDAMDAFQRIGYPAVVKPTTGSGNSGVRVVEDVDAASRFAEAYVPGARWLVQQRLRADAEYHLDSLVTEGRLVAPIASRYSAPCLTWDEGSFHGSETINADNDEATVVEHLGAAAVRALGLLQGVVHVEVLRVGDRLVCNEIACRPGGGGIGLALDATLGRSFWAEVAALERTGVTNIDEYEKRPGYGWVALSTRPGRVLQMSSPDELLAIDGVERVQYTVQVGEHVRTTGGAYTVAGYCLTRSTSAAGHAAVRSAVEREFKIEVDDAE
ncbi:ATP-grasp domain-containing protein [Curtobacterium sp. VKM Ac-1376]|uniref:ATP-grasp domain-containing protein n=1 Tax=Curtobacterium sp. VKM Ac-1376 TaxID=123312 RepID=UPI00188DB522|nr:ATP-grasp domain-containing protein [Curtobacterium sp. VKM Ac-1376]MBF4615502.1 ATP-grasp domain-containing protein [Curtobacterium sp. VKM Ac-1376]